MTKALKLLKGYSPNSVQCARFVKVASLVYHKHFNSYVTV